MAENKFNHEKQQLENTLQFQTRRNWIEENVNLIFIVIKIYSRTSTPECFFELARFSKPFSTWLK